MSTSAFKSRLEYAKRTMEEKRQVGVVVHRDHPTLAAQGIKLPDKEIYAVLGGWWVITDIWVIWGPGMGGKTTMVLMTKLELVDESTCWWFPGQASEVIGPLPVSGDTTLEASCITCRRLVVARYPGLPLCGHPDCASSQSAAASIHLLGQSGYLPEYIANREPKDQCSANYHPYLPPVPTQLSKYDFGHLVRDKSSMVTKPGWRAYVCIECCAFNQRTHWSYLQCRRCRRIEFIRLPNIDVTDLLNNHFTGLRGQLPMDDAFLESNIDQFIKSGKGVMGRTKLHTTRYTFERFDLGHNNSVMVGFPNWEVIVKELGPSFHSLWDLTRTDGSGKPPLLDLVRAPTRTGLGASEEGKTLTAWFGRNFGIPYTARMKMPNDPMDQAPETVLELLEFLEENVKEALAASGAADSTTAHTLSPRFNEALPIGNYPGQGMHWHSDDEKGVVGDIVASVSLGGLAHMSFALKHKYRVGRLHQGKNIAHVDDVIVKGTLKEEEKLQIQAEFLEGATSWNEATERMSALVRDIKCSQRSVETILKFPLPFGAVMVQQGKSLNEIYVHQVELAKGELARFVLTGRTLANGEE